jgi:hypothetical protein
MSDTEICDDCAGTGECPECHGEDSKNCEHCAGSGICPWCNGVGGFELDEEEVLQ